MRESAEAEGGFNSMHSGQASWRVYPLSGKKMKLEKEKQEM
jgi:hypothetical protein